MLFINNKYTKYYYMIIDSRSQLERSKGNGEYYEAHHIIPKSLGGDNSQNNLVLLTAREHFICHWLLKYMTEGEARAKMVTAINGMRRSSLNINYNTPITARVYENNRIELAKVISKWNSGKNNPFYGKKHTEETRAKQSMPGESNPFYGKKHTEETRAKISKNTKKAMASIERTPMSEEKRKKLSKMRKGVARTPEDIAKMYEGHKWKVKFYCPKCDRDGFSPTPFTRYHRGGKCKGVKPLYVK